MKKSLISRKVLTRKQHFIKLVTDPLYAQGDDSARTRDWKSTFLSKFEKANSPKIRKSLTTLEELNLGRSAGAIVPLMEFLVKGNHLPFFNALQIVRKLQTVKDAAQFKVEQTIYNGRSGGGEVVVKCDGIGNLKHVYLTKKIASLPKEEQEQYIMSAIGDAMSTGRAEMYQEHVKASNEAMDDLYHALERYNGHQSMDNYNRPPLGMGQIPIVHLTKNYFRARFELFQQISDPEYWSWLDGEKEENTSAEEKKKNEITTFFDYHGVNLDSDKTAEPLYADRWPDIADTDYHEGEEEMDPTGPEEDDDPAIDARDDYNPDEPLDVIMADLGGLPRSMKIINGICNIENERAQKAIEESRKNRKEPISLTKEQSANLLKMLRDAREFQDKVARAGTDWRFHDEEHLPSWASTGPVDPIQMEKKRLSYVFEMKKRAGHYKKGVQPFVAKADEE